MGHLPPPFDLAWVRPSPKSRSIGRNVEDPKAWKPRKAWRLNMKETRTEKPTLGKNGIQSHASRLVGQISQWSGPGPGPQRMECARKHLGEGLRQHQNEQASLGERDGFPLGLQIRGAG